MIYKGIVKDNNSPKMDGKLKVYIPGIHPDLNSKNNFESFDVQHLPWIEVIQSELHKGIGISKVIGIDTWVHVYVPDDTNDIDRMLVLGCVGNSEIDFHDIQKGKQENLKNFSESSGDASVSFDGSKDGESKYPNTTVIHTKAGHLIVIDDTSGNERIKLQDKNGSYIELNNNGITQYSTGDVNYYTEGALKEFVSKEVNKIFNGAIKVGAKRVDIKINGDLNIEASGTVEVKGALIKLN